MPEEIPFAIKKEVASIIRKLRAEAPEHFQFGWGNSIIREKNDGQDFSRHDFYFDELPSIRPLQEKFWGEMQLVLAKHNLPQDRQSEISRHLYDIADKQLTQEVRKGRFFKRVTFFATGNENGFGIEVPSGEVYSYQEGRTYLKKERYHAENLEISPESHPEKFEKFREILIRLKPIIEKQSHYEKYPIIRHFIESAERHFATSGTKKP